MYSSLACVGMLWALALTPGQNGPALLPPPGDNVPALTAPPPATTARPREPNPWDAPVSRLGRVVATSAHTAPGITQTSHQVPEIEVLPSCPPTVTTKPAGPAALPSGVCPAPPSSAEMDALARQATQLRSEREALAAERAAQARPQPAAPAEAPLLEEKTRLQNRIRDLLQRLETQAQQPPPPVRMQAPPAVRPPAPEIKPPPQPAPRTAPPPAVEAPQAPPAPRAEKKPVAGTGNPVDLLLLAHATFRTGNFEAALRAYRGLDLAGLRAADQVMVQYLTATCLRKLGKIEEASTLYREVANSRGNDFLAECAQWHLANLQGRQDLQNQLAQLRQRRQEQEGKP